MTENSNLEKLESIGCNEFFTKLFKYSFGSIRKVLVQVPTRHRTMKNEFLTNGSTTHRVTWISSRNKSGLRKSTHTYTRKTKKHKRARIICDFFSFFSFLPQHITYNLNCDRNEHRKYNWRRRSSKNAALSSFHRRQENFLFSSFIHLDDDTIFLIKIQ